jgi:hypothetical protein
MRSTPVLIAAMTSVAVLGGPPALGAGTGPVGNGVSVTPPSLSVPARAGTIGTIDVRNTTGGSVKVTVTVHPWVQSLTGAASPNQASTEAAVKVSAPTFELANNVAAPITLSLSKVPASGSLYANIDVVAFPATQPKIRGSHITYGYRIIGSLRVNPARPRYAVRVGGVVVSGNHARGTVLLPVTNTGNVLITAGGSDSVRGGRGGATGQVSGLEVLPGATVDVPVLTLDGTLPSGVYQLSAALTGSGHSLGTVRKSFTLR